MSFYMSRHVEREILSALIDGELTADERRMVHEHLQGCADCREIVEEFGQIHGMVTELPRLVAPVAFVSEVLEGPDPKDARSPWSRALGGRLRRRAIVATAAAAIAVTLAGLVTPPQGEQPDVAQLVDRHVSVHSGVEPGAQVLVGVNGRNR